MKILSFKKFSSIFQFFGRTVASTETNDTSTERSDIQFFEVGKSEGVALSGGLHAYLLQKDIEKKIMELSQNAKKKYIYHANLFLIL